MKLEVYSKGNKRLSDFILNSSKKRRGDESSNPFDNSKILFPDSSFSRQKNQTKNKFSISPNVFRTGNTTKKQIKEGDSF